MTVKQTCQYDCLWNQEGVEQIIKPWRHPSGKFAFSTNCMALIELSLAILVTSSVILAVFYGNLQACLDRQWQYQHICRAVWSHGCIFIFIYFLRCTCLKNSVSFMCLEIFFLKSSKKRKWGKENISTDKAWKLNQKYFFSSQTLKFRWIF